MAATPRDPARRLRRDSTWPERTLWAILRDRRLAGWKFRRQVPLGPFIVDFACYQARLIVEVDGHSHDDRAEADHARQTWLERAGWRVHRVSNDDILGNRDPVIGSIQLLLDAAPGSRP